jgi:ubiquinone/menaquinone biosynthesis C-methylase UbiE
MINKEKCNYCGGTEMSRINTYKSNWYSCNDCGSIVRETKDRYFFEKIIPRSWWGKISPQKLALTRPRTMRELIVYALYKNREMSGEDMYDYYLDPALEGDTSGAHSKWGNETNELLKELEQFNINIKGKTVLEISGGPGFVAKNLEKIAKKYIVTEFNGTAAGRMKTVLGLHAHKYDFNTDDIGAVLKEEVGEGKVDVILMRHCVNFCLDIPKFLEELQPYLSENAVAYVSTVLPTLGNCVRWSLDDYTFLALQNPETIAKNFAEKGFVQFGVMKQDEYHFLHSRIHRYHLYASPLTVPTFLWNRLKHVNTESLVKLRVLFFKRVSR